MTYSPMDEEVITAEQFSQRWGDFLASLEKVARRGLRRNPNEDFRKHLLPLLNGVLRVSAQTTVLSRLSSPFLQNSKILIPLNR
jgi:hypothetical protein